MTEIAGVTVLYNPEPEHLHNLNSHASQVNRLFVVDNSPADNTPLITKYLDPAHWPGVKYVPNKENLGIAKALNQGASLAGLKGYTRLLTMDQDSWLPQGTVALLSTIFDRQEKMNHNPGLVAAHAVAHCRVNESYTLPDPDSLHIDSPLLLPGSGNLICLRAHVLVGGFNEHYFIDDVDFEYCLRLRQAGYKISWLPEVLFGHSLGRTTWHSIGKWKNVPAYNHPPLRRYYITRNRLFTLKRYARSRPELLSLYWRMTWRELAPILMFEEKKLKKFFAVALGLYHYLINRQGPLKIGS
jgi:rhamnosyltransferase